jgi:hypothetical protein
MHKYCNTLLFSALLAPLLLGASTKPPLPLSQKEIDNFLEELTAPLNDGFQVYDLFTIAGILKNRFSSIDNLSMNEKKTIAIYLLQETLNQHYFLPTFEKKMLEQMIPALATLLFPSSIDTTLFPPEATSPSQIELIEATNTLITKLDKKMEWSDISTCLLYVCQFASSYHTLSPQDKAYIAKQMLKEFIDKTDTPFLPDVIFDEVFKRIGYAMIDYVTLQSS